MTKSTVNMRTTTFLKYLNHIIIFVFHYKKRLYLIIREKIGVAQELSRLVRQKCKFYELFIGNHTSQHKQKYVIF